jgi:hypothetical protein
MERNREYRMYGLVPYNLSPIQQGIQFGHAVVEYGLEFGSTPAYQKWAKEDKTFIILNGGTTNTRFNLEDGLPCGSLNNHLYNLALNNMQIATFHEPDLGDQLTAVVFLVDDRVWDKVTWPDYDGPYYADMKTPEVTAHYEWKMKFADTEKEASNIVFLRDFLKNFRLA